MKRSVLLSVMTAAAVLLAYPAVAEETGSAATETAASASAISEKLKRIVIPRLQFRDANIDEAIDYLRKKSVDLDTAEADPQKRGVNVVLKLEKSPGVTVSVTQISLSLTNVSLLDALEHVTSLAKLKYKIEHNAVVIVPKS